MKVTLALQALVIATATTAAQADYKYFVPSQIKYVTPLSGEINCEVSGYTKRISSDYFSKYEAEAWKRKQGERSMDICVFPESLIFTGNGARAQFIYGWGIGTLEEGNEYSETWADINCERMESRSTTSVWTYSLNRPDQGYAAKNMKWHKRLNLPYHI